MTWRLLPVARFGEVQAQWQTLNARSGNTPVLHPDFVAPLLQEFASPAERLAILDGAAGPAAMTVLSRRNGLAWQSFQPANAPIGLWVCDPAQPLPELLRDLLRSLPGPAGLLGLLQQDPDITPRPPDGNGLSTLDYIETARVSVSQPFEEYWAQRGKNLRRNMKRQHAQLEREGIPPRLEVLSESHRHAARHRGLRAPGRYWLEARAWNRRPTGRPTVSLLCRHDAALLCRRKRPSVPLFLWGRSGSHRHLH